MPRVIAGQTIDVGLTVKSLRALLGVPPWLPTPPSGQPAYSFSGGVVDAAVLTSGQEKEG